MINNRCEKRIFSKNQKNSHFYPFFDRNGNRFAKLASTAS